MIEPIFIFSEYCEKSSFPSQTLHVYISLVPRPLGRPGFEGCLARELNFPRSARCIPGQPGSPPQYHGVSSNISSRPPRKRSGGPSKIGSGPSWTPTNAREVPQKSHLGPKIAQDGRLWAQLDPHKRSGGPSKIASWPQDGPRWPSDDPQMIQDGPKIAPKWPQDGPRWPKIAPRSPMMAPRWPKMAPRWRQDGPKMAQDGPRWRQDGPKLDQDSAT